MRLMCRWEPVVDARRNQPDHLFMKDLPVTGVVVVPDHEVYRKPFKAPVCVGADELF